MSFRHYPRPATAFGAAAVVVLLLAARRLDRVVVTGASMRPAVVAGDRVLVVRGMRVRPGAVVAASDPRQSRRVIVKRVAAVGVDGSLHLTGDDPSASTDSRHFGPVPRHLVRGRAVWRYWPPDRRGKL